ncbi:MAG: hypothetical protein AAF411_29635 [Myxococcota bacterium]
MTQDPPQRGDLDDVPTRPQELCWLDATVPRVARERRDSALAVRNETLIHLAEALRVIPGIDGLSDAARRTIVSLLGRAFDAGDDRSHAKVAHYQNRLVEAEAELISVRRKKDAAVRYLEKAGIRLPGV